MNNQQSWTKEVFYIGAGRRRTAVFYIGAVIALFAVLSALTYYLYDYGDKTFSDGAVVCMVLGGILYLLVVFTRLKSAPVLSAVLYTVGFAKALAATLPSLSDVWNGVNFIGGFAYMGLFFTVQFAFCALASIVCAFFAYDKPKRIKNKE